MRRFRQPPTGNRRNLGRLRFTYPAQRYFVEYLRARFGVTRFQQFLRKNIVQPATWRATFAEIYALPFEQAVQAYSAALRTGQWAPVE